MTETITGVADHRGFERLLAALRPRLHRYCARMTGSVIDGEDVLQDALLKAAEAYDATARVENVEGWIFRIAHNAAIDFLRRRARHDGVRADEELDMIADPADTVRDREAAATGLHAFMRLPAAQRSSVILMDVLGYSLREIGEIMGTSVPTVKAALHRGRASLRNFAAEPDDRPLPVLAGRERALLLAYVERFNARDFDAIRDMLAEEVRLDLVGRERLHGRNEVGVYFGNYARVNDWRLAPGFVDRRPAILVSDPASYGARPVYFILLGWHEDHLLTIRDFRYARYAVEDGELLLADRLAAERRPRG
jgi:RNA polymerase sigma-70 factor (ECF subfamily)